MTACHVVNDFMGDHAISCAIGGERISKHNHVRDAIFKAAVEAGLGTRTVGPVVLSLSRSHVVALIEVDPISSAMKFMRLASWDIRSGML